MGLFYCEYIKVINLKCQGLLRQKWLRTGLGKGYVGLRAIIRDYYTGKRLMEFTFSPLLNY
jgi:hypothetical protein